MARLSKPLLLLAALSVAGLAHADLLPKPDGLSVDEAAGPRFSWSPVDGAAVYRVAVFDAPDAEGKRPLLAAVWVKAAGYQYAKDTVIPKAGKLGSTTPLPLPAGHKLRVMVAAAREQGADKSDWVGADFSVKALVLPTSTPAPSPTFTASPTPGTGKPGADAELELEGGEEFKSSPEPAVIDLHEGGESVAVTASSALLGGVKAEPSLDAARGLVKAGKGDEAEAMFRVLTERDPKNADAWEGLGDVYEARQMRAEARDAYEEALKLDKSKTNLKAWIERNVRR